MCWLVKNSNNRLCLYRPSAVILCFPLMFPTDYGVLQGMKICSVSENVVTE